jgi:hypothetical protein
MSTVSCGITRLSSYCTMSSAKGKISAVLHLCVHPPQKCLPISSNEHEVHLICFQEINSQINDILEGFLAKVNSVAAKMSNKFGLSHHQALDLLFQSGIKMQQECNNPSAWTAFLSQKASEATSSLCFLPLLFFHLTVSTL